MTASGDWRQAATPEQMLSVTRTADSSRARMARVQDYWLGGKDHFEADRIAGEEVVAQLPGHGRLGARYPGISRPDRPLPGRAGRHQAVPRHRHGHPGRVAYARGRPARRAGVARDAELPGCECLIQPLQVGLCTRTLGQSDCLM